MEIKKLHFSLFMSFKLLVLNKLIEFAKKLSKVTAIIS